MTSHVDTETLALLAEGLLEENEERSVEAHVSECAQCGDQLAALGDVTRVLAEVPAPPIPDGLIGRIDDALRAEREHQRAAGPAAAAPVGDHGGAVPLQHRNSPTRWMPYLVAAAAAVLVVGGGTAVVQGLTTSSDSGPQVADQQPKAGESTRPDTAAVYQPLVVASGTEYTKKDLDTQAAEVIGRAALDPAPESSEGAPESSAKSDLPQPEKTPTGVSTCVRRLTGEDQRRPVLIDIASFVSTEKKGEGKKAEKKRRDAWVLVYEADPADDAKRYGVRLVTPDCSKAGDSGDATLAETEVTGRK